MTSDQTIDAYLARIGFTGRCDATLATLQALHRLHPAAIAFENIDVLMRHPISLEPAAIAAKLVADGRGGYCYEQNTLLLAVLRTLGFRVISVGARILWNAPAGTTPARVHMLLLVDLPEGRHLADVGFGRLTLGEPLRLQPGVEQPTGQGTYRVIRSGDEFQLQAALGADWTAIYQFSLEEKLAADWDVIHWHTSTHPSSIFTRSLMVSRSADASRYALLDNRLRIYDRSGVADQRVLATADELRATLRDDFKLELPTGCDDVLARAVRGPE
jgi:N-hydroxyarylamine O-acetyltransferase